MANMDKSLPNEVRNTIEIPGPGSMNEEQIDIQEELPDPGTTEITPTGRWGSRNRF
jgi:hypothetical protein